MWWRQLGKNNAREHATVYLLATASNLFISIPLYIAARAGALALIPIQGSTAQFISAYGVNRGIILDFLWTLFVYQGLLAVPVIAVAGTSLLQKRWKGPYVFSAFVTVGFVGYWLGARFLQTLDWVSLLQNRGIDSSSAYSDLFWYGLGATIFYVAMILALRRSYHKLAELKTSGNVLIQEQHMPGGLPD